MKLERLFHVNKTECVPYYLLENEAWFQPIGDYDAMSVKKINNEIYLMKFKDNDTETRTADSRESKYLVERK